MIFQQLFKIVASDKDDNVVCCGKTDDESILEKVHDELIKNGYQVWTTELVPCSRFGGNL